MITTNPEAVISDETITARYNNYLRSIFTWGVFRNKSAQNRKELNLDEMRRTCEVFGNPQKNSFKIVHMAGTNGKGSVSIKVAKSLQAMGYKVGLFTSPHISTFRERFQINGQLISEREMVDLCQEVFEIVENSKLDIRFFEIITILGFLIFNRAKCDFVCLEVGLGGKLDATNVVDGEDVICSTIVSLGMDHMDVIGDTIEDIAEEKCGIIKLGTPVVLGPTCQNLEPVKKALEASGSPFVQVQKHNTHCEDNDQVTYEIMKIIAQKQNLELPEGLMTSISSTSQPCRFEVIPNRSEQIVLDVCHNIDGFRAVLDTIAIRFPNVDNIKFVFGISKSKTLTEIAKLLEETEKIKDVYVVSRTHMRLHKAEDAHKLLSVCGSSKLRDIIADPVSHDMLATRSDDTQSDGTISQSGDGFQQNITKTLDTILSKKEMQSEKSLLLICGSFFIMSDVKHYFGFTQECDTL